LPSIHRSQEKAADPDAAALVVNRISKLYLSDMLSPVFRRRTVQLVALVLVFATTSGGGLASAHLKRRVHTVRHQVQSKQAPPATGSNKSLQSVAEAWLNRPELAHSLAGIDVIDLESGTEIVCANGRKRFTPASTAKVFATACAYEKLGPGFVYKTSLATTGEVEGSKIKGDLLLVTSQDPTTDRDDLRRLFANLRDKGIKDVEGKLVLSEVTGGGQRFLGEWLSEDWAQDYMPVSSSLVLDRNMSSPGVFPKPKYTLNPVGTIDNALQKTLIQSDLTLGWIHYDKADKTVHVYTQDESKGVMASRAVANPDAFNLALAEEIAKGLGLHFGNRTITEKPQATLHTLAVHESQPLAKIIRTTLHESDNLYAQQILRTIGSEADLKGHGPTLEETGLLKERSWLASFGVPIQEVILWDGCGLSRKDFISPYSLNMVLRHMATSNAKGYVELLTPATIQPRGSFNFKTGSMDSVRGITGLLEMQDGKRLAITVLVNGHTPSVGILRTSLGVLISQMAQAKVEIPKAAPSEDTENSPDQ
jgi:serine-type D-Ala-D-Ala carboxypeptidase/endopeptidase (penicillin-binding protein 4)